MLFRFCCDESHEGRQGSECCTISGFFSNIPTWEEVEERWDEINHNYGVPRFHAQHLNRRDIEYEGWCNREHVLWIRRTDYHPVLRLKRTYRLLPTVRLIRFVATGLPRVQE